jgi:hypothetical protein
MEGLSMTLTSVLGFIASVCLGILLLATVLKSDGGG